MGCYRRPDSIYDLPLSTSEDESSDWYATVALSRIILIYRQQLTSAYQQQTSRLSYVPVGPRMPPNEIYSPYGYAASRPDHSTNVLSGSGIMYNHAAYPCVCPCHSEHGQQYPGQQQPQLREHQQHGQTTQVLSSSDRMRPHQAICMPIQDLQRTMSVDQPVPAAENGVDRSQVENTENVEDIMDSVHDQGEEGCETNRSHPVCPHDAKDINSHKE